MIRFFNLYSLMKQRSCQTVKPNLPSPLCPVSSFHHHHPVPPLFQKIPPGDWGRCLERTRDTSHQRRPGGREDTVCTHLKHKTGSFSHVGVYHNSICLNDQYSSFMTNSLVFPPNQAGPPLVGWGWKFSLKNNKSISYVFTIQCCRGFFSVAVRTISAVRGRRARLPAMDMGTVMSMARREVGR